MYDVRVRISSNFLCSLFDATDEASFSIAPTERSSELCNLIPLGRGASIARRFVLHLLRRSGQSDTSTTRPSHDVAHEYAANVLFWEHPIHAPSQPRLFDLIADDLEECSLAPSGRSSGLSTVIK